MHADTAERPRIKRKVKGHLTPELRAAAYQLMTQRGAQPEIIAVAFAVSVETARAIRNLDVRTRRARA